MTQLTLQATFNDATMTRAIFERWGHDLACVIVEPIAGNMGFVRPVDGFLEQIRALCDEYGVIMILDEVMTGFRVAKGGAQRRFRVKPDLTTIGKVVGGGLPAAGYGGRADLMARIAPDGPVYQAGTLSGNPLAMAAGIETLRRLGEKGVYPKLGAVSKELVVGLREAAAEAGLPFTADYEGGMFGFFFHEGPVRNFDDAKKADAELFVAFFRAMLAGGIYLAPSPFEAGFVSLAHRPRDLARTLEVAREAMRKLAARR